MALAEQAPPVRAPRLAAPRSTSRFFQRYATLLILLGLCLVFTVIGPWRTAREACNLWQQVGTLSLVKNGQLCTPVFASQVNLLNLVRQVLGVRQVRQVRGVREVRRRTLILEPCRRTLNPAR